MAMGGGAVREVRVAGFADGGRKPPGRERGMPLEAGKSRKWILPGASRKPGPNTFQRHEAHAGLPSHRAAR